MSSIEQRKDHSHYSTELAFGDLLTRFLRYARVSIDVNHTLHLARAIGQFFAVCPIEVLWEENIAGNLGRMGARWSFPDHLSALSEEEVGALAEQYRRQVKLSTLRDLCLEFSEAGAETSIYLIADEPPSEFVGSRTDSLWLIIKQPEGQVDGAALRKEIEGRHELFRRGPVYLETIHTSFVAIQRLPRAAELYFEVRSFIERLGMSPADRLREAANLVGKLSRVWARADSLRCITLAKSIAESVIQSAIGDGVDVTSSSVDDCQQGAKTFVESLNDIQQQGEVSEISEVATATAQLAALCRTVRSIFADPGDESSRGEDPQRAGGDLNLELLADWTCLHQEARRQRHKVPGQRDSPRKAWYPWAGRTFGQLKRFLCGHFHKEIDVRYISPWLRLWFCHELLYHARVTEASDEPWNNWRFCEHLAYVVRESLRVFVYGERADYSFRAPELAEALRTLVEHHAVHVLQLPSDPDIRGLLNEISSMHSSHGYLFVSGHMQHVLEVYIAGQFMCDLKVKSGNDDWTGEQVLASRSAWKPRRLSVGEFRRAFSLAALLHDVGRLLLPRWSPTAEKWLRVDKTLLKNLAGVERSVLDSMAQLMSQCVEELEAEGYFDPAAERAVKQWVEDRIERREVDFPLISAWFLHRICQNVQGLHGDTVRQAVRAVLFHQMVTKVVDVDCDPAAGLLVLCDQIFAWNANKVWVTPGETGHSFQAIAADIRPQPPIFELLELEGLQYESEGEPDEPLAFRINRSGGFWPHFVVTLRKPEALEVPLIWVGLAQSLCRIAPSRKHEWAPRVTVRSEIPKRMRSQKRCTFDLLAEVVSEGQSRLRGALSRFITEAKPLRVGDREQIELCPLGRPLHREDLSPLLPELQGVLEKLLSRRDGGST